MTMSEEHSKVLNSILSVLNHSDAEVSEADYQSWKQLYETLPEDEKVFRLLVALSQYLLSGCNASAAILASAVICTQRWCEEKSDKDF